MEAAVDEVKLCNCVNTAAKDCSVDRNTIPIIQLYNNFYHYGPNGKRILIIIYIYRYGICISNIRTKPA